MGAESQTKTASSLPVLGVLLVIAGAYYISQSQLKSSRPKAPAELGQVVTEQGMVKARLWQDPLKVTLDHERTVHGQAKAEDGGSRRG